jgi:hypothetical protein
VQFERADEGTIVSMTLTQGGVPIRLIPEADEVKAQS